MIVNVYRNGDRCSYIGQSDNRQKIKILFDIRANFLPIIIQSTQSYDDSVCFQLFQSP